MCSDIWFTREVTTRSNLSITGKSCFSKQADLAILYSVDTSSIRLVPNDGTHSLKRKTLLLPHWLFLESRDKNDAILQVNNEPLRTNLCSMQRQKSQIVLQALGSAWSCSKPLKDMLIFQCVTFTLSKNSHYENDHPMHPAGRALTSDWFINSFVMVYIRKKLVVI